MTTEQELRAEVKQLQEKLAELEANQWTPVPDGIHKLPHPLEGIATDDDCLLVTDYAADDEHCEFMVRLPDDMRLCRRQGQEEMPK